MDEVEERLKPSVLVVHERYQQHGGEDVAVAADLALLESRGHRVAYYERNNDEIDDLNAVGRVQLATGTIWSGRSRKELGEHVDRFCPDLVHVHNTFPLLSPSIYGAAKERGVPVIKTVHNYRLLCATGALQRDGHLCYECMERRLPLPAVTHGCYRGSRSQSAVIALMQVTHRLKRTWTRDVDLYLAVSRHVLRRLVDAGAVPPDRAMVRRNHLSPDPGVRHKGSDQGYAVFAGRLSPEKGADVLIRASALVPDLPVRIVGDGPERERLMRLADELHADHISFLGQLTRNEVLKEMRGARCLVLPSTWEEPMGLVLVEAAALGVPVIGSNIGGTPELVVPGTGMLVPPGDVPSLTAALKDAVRMPAAWWERGMSARRYFQEFFTADRAYEALLAAYRRVGAVTPAVASSWDLPAAAP